MAEVVLLMLHMNGTPLQIRQTRDWTPGTAHCPRFSNGCCKAQGTDGELLPYFRRLHKLSMEEVCILWERRVIIPAQGRRAMIKELHEAHPGVSRMKMLARSYVWWPNMDADLEVSVCRCHACQSNQATPAVTPLHPWAWPQKQWMRVHVDFCGPLYWKMFLIVVHAYSKMD